MVQINSFVVQKCCEEVFVSFRGKRFRVLGWAAAGSHVYPVILFNGRPACMARFEPEEYWSVEEDTQEEEESELEEGTEAEPEGEFKRGWDAAMRRVSQDVITDREAEYAEQEAARRARIAAWTEKPKEGK
jgi:hypothetical protein